MTNAISCEKPLTPPIYPFRINLFSSTGTAMRGFHYIANCPGQWHVADDSAVTILLVSNWQVSTTQVHRAVFHWFHSVFQRKWASEISSIWSSLNTSGTLLDLEEAATIDTNRGRQRKYHLMKGSRLWNSQTSLMRDTCFLIHRPKPQNMLYTLGENRKHF
jgi:hypothetical protein